MSVKFAASVPNVNPREFVEQLQQYDLFNSDGVITSEEKPEVLKKVAIALASLKARRSGYVVFDFIVGIERKIEKLEAFQKALQATKGNFDARGPVFRLLTGELQEHARFVDSYLGNGDFEITARETRVAIQYSKKALSMREGALLSLKVPTETGVATVPSNGGSAELDAAQNMVSGIEFFRQELAKDERILEVAEKAEAGVKNK